MTLHDTYIPVDIQNINANITGLVHVSGVSWFDNRKSNITLTSFVFNTASFGLLPFRWNTPQTQMIHPQQNLSHRNYQVIILG